MTLPVPNATQPFWRNQPHALDNHRSTEDLPTEADIVIVGAGYAGASIAYHLLEQTKNGSKKPSIVILEAREACSGATGRNGGHLKPDPYLRAAAALKLYGREVAEEAASFEARQIQAIKDLVEKENIDCDFVLTRATDVCMYEDAHQKLKSGLDALREANISTAKDVFYSDGKSAEGISGVKGVKGCFTYTAAHVWPYKLVTHLLSHAVAQGVNLQTHTAVDAVRPAANQTWDVTTARGSLRAAKVIHASNAYTSHLLPEFREKIHPVRGICCRIVPTKPHAPLLSNSYMLRLGPGEYDYLIPRSDGSIVVGGAKRDYYRHLHEWYGNVDDSQLIDSAKHYFDGYMQRLFRGWEDSGAYTDQIWTGVMGFSSDGFPFVDHVPGKPGQLVCAGFSGHGMPQIFLSAQAIASMALGDRSPAEVGLPRLYSISKERMESKRNDTLDEWGSLYGKGAAKL